jgi:hypothetical protein
LSNRSSTRGPFRLIAVLTGIALLVYLIARTGAGTVIEHLKAVGWGMVLVLALGGIQHLMRASAWRLTFRSDLRGLSIPRAFGLRLIAEAIGTFGFAGQLVGDSTRISLLGPVIPIEDRISSIALDRATFVVSSGTVAVTGVLAAVIFLSLTGAWRVYSLVFSAAITLVLALALFSFTQGWHLFSHFTHGVQRLPWAKKCLADKAAVIESAEENLLNFRSRAPKSFWAVIFLYFASQMTAITEVYLLLRFMGVRITLLGAFIVEGFTKLIDVLGAVNPGNLGTFEGGNLLVARLLGFPAAAGLTLAICRRARILFWTAIGALCLIAWSPGKRQSPAESG